MTEEPAAGAAAFTASEIEALARDWIAIWQSELGSYAADREASEAWLRLLALWAGAATSLISAYAAAPTADSPAAGPDDWTAGHPGATQKARASAAAAASEPSLAALERLDQRLARLEQRIAALERAILAGSRPAGRRPRPARGTRRDGISPRSPG